MKHIALSDHVDDRIRALRGERESVYAHQLARHEAIASSITAYREDACAQFVGGLKRFNLIDVVGGSLRAAHASLWETIPSRPLIAVESDAELRWVAGGLAEDGVLACLFEQLQHTNAVVFSGYRNRYGEIDLIVVMEHGAAAIEVKSYRGYLSASGNQWWADRYDQYGNWVEQRPVHDRGGRTPAQQLNQATGELSRFLDSKRCVHWFNRAVILTHPDAWIGDINTDEQQLHVVARLDHLDVARLCEAPAPGTEYDINMQGTVALIERDHRYHERQVFSRRAAR